MTFRAHWRRQWADAQEAQHRHATAEWYAFYARELQLYFPERPLRALELGCGNGDLHGYLASRFSSYVGVDFSPAMLARFQRRWPAVTLICADAAHLPLRAVRYDLIFSNEVCQFLDEEMLRRNLQQAHDLLDAAGTYVIANIPDVQLRWHYYAGALRSDRDFSWRGLIRFLGGTVLGRNGDGTRDIGRWYSRRFINQLSAEYGFTCQTYSSASHEYRFHAVLKKQRGTATT
jgi:SAM-dependent methyltransferase